MISKEDFQKMLTENATDTTSDGFLRILETVDEIYAEQGEDWKTKYEENDAHWREVYRDRFMSGEPKQIETEPPVEDNPEEKIGFNDLFKE